MRESIGSMFLYNVIILFIIVTFAFLSGTLSYMKAFKANSRIVNAVEKFEGYNDLTNQEIVNVLSTLGYKTGKADCKTKEGVTATSQIGEQNFQYCLYQYPTKSKDYYGVVTYMYFDFPFIGNFKIPLYTKTEKVYRFNT